MFWDRWEVVGRGFGKMENGSRGGVENGQKNKVLRMRYSIVENVRTPCGILLNISRPSQLPYNKKSKNTPIFINFVIFPRFSV